MATLRNIRNAQYHAAQCLTVYNNWQTYQTNGTIPLNLVKAVNAIFLFLKIPQLTPVSGPIGNDDGRLRFGKWELVINENLIQGTINPIQMRELCATIYHESRHAEQWFRIAQGIAAGAFGTQETNGFKLAKRLWMSPQIGVQAVKTCDDFTTYITGKDLAHARLWYRSIYGQDADTRNEILEALDTTPTQFNINRYRNLPEEIDARNVENMARIEMKKKMKPPPVPTQPKHL